MDSWIVSIIPLQLYMQVCLHSSLKYPVVEPSSPVSQPLSHSLPLRMTTKMFSGEACGPANQDLVIKVGILETNNAYALCMIMLFCFKQFGMKTMK